jgi:hypothetical protein
LYAGSGRREALPLVRCHLSDYELAVGDLLADVLELLFALLELAQLGGTWHGLSRHLRARS